MPDPDLLIRTGGEKRISNFLLWQIAYSELFMTEAYWPDFREELLMKSIFDFSKSTTKIWQNRRPGFIMRFFPLFFISIFAFSQQQQTFNLSEININ